MEETNCFDGDYKKVIIECLNGSKNSKNKFRQLAERSLIEFSYYYCDLGDKLISFSEYINDIKFDAVTLLKIIHPFEDLKNEKDLKVRGSLEYIFSDGNKDYYYFTEKVIVSYIDSKLCDTFKVHAKELLN